MKSRSIIYLGTSFIEVGVDVEQKKTSTLILLYSV